MPSYQYAIAGAQPADGLDAVVDVFPNWRELVAQLWPELAAMTLRLTPEGAASGEIAVTVTDEIDDAQALAFHTRTMFGAVQCVVERQQCLKYGVPIGVALLHEVAEAGINPQLARYVTAPLAPAPGAAAVPTRLPLEVVDPVTNSIVPVNGIPCCNVSGPRYWLLAQTGKLDLIGAATATLPQIPLCGAIENAAGQLQYGDAVTPELQRYLAEKRGRRWALRQGLTVIA